MRVDQPEPGSFADRADPAVSGAAVEALSVVAAQDRAFSAFADGEVDGPGGPRDQGDEGGLVALAEDPKCPMSSVEGQVLDVGLAGFADPKAVQSSRTARAAWAWSKRSAVKRNGRVRRDRAPALGGVDIRPANVLGWVGGDPPVDVGEAIEAADRGQTAVDGRRGQTPLLHRESVHSMWGRLPRERPGRCRRPTGKGAQVEAVSVEGPAAVAGQEGGGCDWPSSKR